MTIYCNEKMYREVAVKLRREEQNLIWELQLVRGACQILKYTVSMMVFLITVLRTVIRIGK
jgi:hypothetical protein